MFPPRRHRAGLRAGRIRCCRPRRCTGDADRRQRKYQGDEARGLLGSSHRGRLRADLQAERVAQLFGVPQLEKRQRPPPAVDGVVAMLTARARKGNAGRWRKAMENFTRLRRLRGRFKEGTRANACWVYASLLRSQPKRITEAEVLTAVEKLWRHGCEWTTTWSKADLEDALRGSRRLAGIRNQVLSDRLDVTPEESALLDNWPPASRFKATDHQAGCSTRPQRTRRRRSESPRNRERESDHPEEAETEQSCLVSYTRCTDRFQHNR